MTIEDDVFVGHGVVFVSDKHPRATTSDGRLHGREDWSLLEIVVERGASLGSGAIVLGGVRVGAGAVVTRDVEQRKVVARVPARARRR